MTRLPEDNHHSLNRAAEICGVQKQDFRKLVGAFEERRISLPKYVNEQGQTVKRIPESVMHVFKEAVMWMGVEGLDEEAAMAKVFEHGRGYRLEQLAEALNDTLFIRAVPDRLEKRTNALMDTINVLLETTEALKRAALRPRGVTVKMADEPLIADAITDVNRRYQRSLLTGIFLFGLLLGGGGSTLFTQKELHTQARQIQRLQNQTTSLQRRLDIKLDRIEDRLQRR